MKIYWGNRGFEFRGRYISMCACLDDVGVKIGPYGLSIMRGRMPITGVFVESPQGNRHWEWDAVRSWFTRKPLAPLDAA